MTRLWLGCAAGRRHLGVAPSADCDTSPFDHNGVVIVRLRHPTREIDIEGPMSVTKLLNHLELHREAVLVIRNGTLVPGDGELAPDDVIEIRPVISGG